MLVHILIRVDPKVKRTAAANNDDKNLAFLTTSSPSSTNTINTVNTGVSTGTTKVNTASTETSTASFSDATVYAFLSTQPQGSQLVHEDLEQLHDDDLEEMDLKWNMALLSMRARKFYQRTGRKIIIDGSNTAGYDKSKVECFNCHKMGHFARECRAPRSKDNRNWNQGSSSKAVKIEDASEKAMCAIDGAGFDWSDMAEDEIQANMALMAFTDSEVSIDKSCSKSCLNNYEALKKQYDDLLVKLDDTGFKAATYKRGHKDYLMGLVKTELEKVKEEIKTEKEGWNEAITSPILLSEIKQLAIKRVDEYGFVIRPDLVRLTFAKALGSSNTNVLDFAMLASSLYRNVSKQTTRFTRLMRGLSSKLVNSNDVQTSVCHGCVLLGFIYGFLALDSISAFWFSNRRLEQTATYSISTNSE
ncbi:ribonuclease H-like domain-containing protein [Tanacetum coccineum]|uniref:Ribonuclease H-like domain-containing protein n=1 Tax=Tanacetum coccineum TaxID=301880 RepID=A0ABQ5BCL6_9ASTR